MIKSIDLTLTLRFTDGSICEISDEDASELEDLTDKRDADCEFKRYDFYPGQVLSGPLKAFETANFTFCSEEMKNFRNSQHSRTKSCTMKSVVDKVKVTSVNVNWQCQVSKILLWFFGFNFSPYALYNKVLSSIETMPLKLLEIGTF